MILFWLSDVLGWCSEWFLVGAASGWRVKALLSLTRSRFNPRLGFMSMLNDTTASHTPDCTARQLAWASRVCVCVAVCVWVRRVDMKPHVEFCGVRDDRCWPLPFSAPSLLDVSGVDILAQGYRQLAIYTDLWKTFIPRGSCGN